MSFLLFFYIWSHNHHTSYISLIFSRFVLDQPSSWAEENLKYIIGRFSTFSTFWPIVKHSQLVITSTTSNATSAWSAFSRHRQVCFDHSSVSGNIICLLSPLPRNSRTCPKCQFPQAPPARTISSLGKAARRLMLDWQPHIYNKRDQSKGDTHPLRSHAIWRYNEVTGEAGWCCRF